MAAARHHLIGRDEELARISTALGSGGSVLLRGEAGIGKTALLQAHARTPSTVSVAGTGDLPLSGFAHLGDAEWHERTPTAIAAALYRTTVRRGTDLLIVDDAHALDPASAGLVLQLARSGTPVLAAARSGLDLPRAIQAVMHQGGETIEVRALPLDEVRLLMEQQLGSPVSLAFATAVAARAGGNPLFVREVVSHVRGAGAATLRRGVWILTGAVPILPVGDLLSERVESLSGRVRFALEIVAAAGTMSIPELLAAVGEATVDRGESEGVIRVHDGQVRPGHPLLRDAALSRLPSGRRARVYETLLRVMGSGDGSAAGSARRVLWRLDGGLPIGAHELLDAAETTFSISVALSERLVTAAAEHGTGPDEAVRLALLWINLGDAERADAALESVAGLPVPELEIAVTAIRAFGMWIVHDRPAEALAVLEDGVQRFGPIPLLQAQRGSTLWRLGRMDEAVRVGESVALDESAPLDARSVAATTLHSIAASRFDQPLIDARRALVSRILSESDRSLGEGRATFTITVAARRSVFEEDLDWAEIDLRGEFTSALERGEEREAAQYGWMLGWSLVLRGRPREAIETMPEFLELDGPWAVINRGWGSACYVRALVTVGEVAAARSELDRLIARSPAPLVAAHVGLAEVDVLAAEGRRPAARERARHHLRTAVAIRDEYCASALAWAELLLGAQDGARSVVQHAERSSMPLHRAQIEVARGIGARDIARTLRGAADLQQLGHRWHALEAVSAASALPGGTAAERGSLSSRYRELTDGQPPIVTRALPPRFEGLAADLTAREREVASLAAQGLSDKEIAERLVVSVRTVETHVAHVFAKTGLHHREELRDVL